MSGDFASFLSYSFLAFLAVLLTVVFGYLFYKDRDKRKLMFMLAFAVASLSYLPKLQTGWESIQALKNLCHWRAVRAQEKCGC